MTLQLYRQENSAIYSQIFEDNYSEINEVFINAKSKCLSVAVNNYLVDMFSSNEAPNTKEYLSLINDISHYYNLESISIYQVQNDADIYCYSQEADIWYKSTMDLSEFNYGHDSIFTFYQNKPDTIRISRFMFDRYNNNKVIAIVNVYISQNELFNYFYYFNPFGDYESKLYLLDETGKTLLPYNNKDIIDLEEESDFEKLMELSFSFKKEALTMSRSFQTNNWKLVAVINNVSFLKGYNSTLWSILIAGLAAEAVSIFLSIFITRRITKPITTLADGVLESAKNDRYEQLAIPKNANGTIRILYENYNYLIDEVNKSIKNIQEISKKDLENQFLLLQAQINPHFLYNTLNTISWMAQNNQNEDIEKMVVSLVTMFRNSLNNGKPLITVEKEIDYVMCYLSIMQYRYPDAYEVECNVQDDLKDFLITKQVLQPLAENALNHGFLEKKVYGKITINVFSKNNEMVFELKNNGSEIDLEKVNKILAGDPTLTSKHYGVRNVDERLRTYYGKESGLKYSFENNETIVRFVLPIEKCRDIYE